MNAKFFIFENDGFIKIKMRPKQRLSWDKYWPTEEGYGYRLLSYYFDEEFVEEENDSGGCDCDGKINHNNKHFCHLKSRMSGLTENGERVLVPDWKKKGHTRVYDKYAQMMGY